MKLIKQIEKLNLDQSSIILENELLKNHTTFGIGGPAKILALPKATNDLIKIINFSNKNNINLSFIGSGSNVLASDNGFDGIVITLKKMFNKIQFNDNNVYTEAGAMLGTMVKTAINKGYEGFESLVGVPGTVGGALIMNAGAHGTEISELLISARTINCNGQIKFYNKKDISFSYRNSTFPENEILLDANFILNKGVKKDIIKKKKEVSLKRKTTQPLKYRSAGSIFKNPSSNLAAGYLIDKSGLKGLRIGDAEISKKHANFIINHGSAKSHEIYKLIKIIKNKVNQKFKIRLKLEIKLIGEIQ
tara:strand:- start:987 stop:1901 length:915 start_codon:yes stop_codon:yes gene_type:complete